MTAWDFGKRKQRGESPRSFLSLASGRSRSFPDDAHSPAPSPLHVPFTLLASSSNQSLAPLIRLSEFYSASYGPKGCLKSFYDQSIKHDVLSSASVNISRQLRVNLLPLKQIQHGIIRQLKSFNDFGLFTGILTADICAEILDEAACRDLLDGSCSQNLRMLKNVFEKCSESIIDMLSDRQKRPSRALDMNSVEDLLSVVETVLRTKSQSGLLRERNLEHVKVLVVQAFLLTIPENDAVEQSSYQNKKGEGSEDDGFVRPSFGKVKIVTECGTPPDKGCAYHGFLYSSPFGSESDLFRSCVFPLGGVKVACLDMDMTVTVELDEVSELSEISNTITSSSSKTQPLFASQTGYRHGDGEFLRGEPERSSLSSSRSGVRDVYPSSMQSHSTGSSSTATASSSSSSHGTYLPRGSVVRQGHVPSEASLSSVTDPLLGFCEDLIAEGIRVFACKNSVADEVKKFLRRRGMVVLERLGSVGFKDFVKFSGARAIEQHGSERSLPLPSAYGRVDAMERVMRYGKIPTLLLKRNNPSLATLVLCANNDYEVDEQKIAVEQTLDLLRSLYIEPYLFPGAGCLETVIGGWLKSNHELVFPLKSTSEQEEAQAVTREAEEVAQNKMILRVVDVLNGLACKVHFQSPTSTTAAASSTRPDLGATSCSVWCYTDDVYNHLWVVNDTDELDDDDGSSRSGGGAEMPPACACGLVLQRNVRENFGRWLSIEGKQSLSRVGSVRQRGSLHKASPSVSMNYLERLRALPLKCCVDGALPKTSAYTVAFDVVHSVLRSILESVGDR